VTSTLNLFRDGAVGFIESRASFSLAKLTEIVLDSGSMNRRLKIPTPSFLIALACFGLSPAVQAVNPPPDGGYPGGNTAEGQNALLSLTSGYYNTAVGFSSLKGNTTGYLNTAVGIGALSSNTTGTSNTANGAAALYSNTTGQHNIANGGYALFSNTTGYSNIAIGTYTMYFNTTGNSNTAIGSNGGLISGTLWDNTTGSGNTAIGTLALRSSNGDGNTGVGGGALINAGGSLNTALGQNAGSNLNGAESNNIYIGANVGGVRGENNTVRIGNTDITDTFISGISGTTVPSGAAVLVDSNGHLGTVTSSKRFKDNIKPMDKASEVLLALKPVTFRYKKEIDPAGISQFGLVAEDVEKVNPDLLVRDQEGTPYTVRYEAVNAMLLNEFLKEHRRVQELEATVAQQRKDSEATAVRQQKQIDALTAGLQKVSAQLEASRSAPQVADSNY
jgi:Chaperone of endosialidase